tara:strand:- start:1632 stop:3167 length:1536 start_codon:yes stop_codon:yes gene_type:complete
MQNSIHKDKKRVMFIEPPFYRLYHDQYCLVKYPLGLGYLSGSVIKNTNWSVQTYNADFNAKQKVFDPENEYISGKGFKRYLSILKDRSQPIWKEIENSIEDFDPSVVGISSKTQNFVSSSIVAKIAKEINPDIKIIVGGVHPTMNGSKVLDCEDIDFLSIGEGEKTIVELLTALEKDKELNSVKGIVFRENGKVITTKPQSYVENLDSLDFPLTNAPKVLKDFDKYPKEAFGYIFASRGCPYACTFCESKSMWTRKVRYRSPENVIAEMKQMYNFGVRKVNFDDDTFGVSKKNIKSINDLLHQELPKMTYTCETVVQLAKDENVVKDMKRGGCTATFVGIESGNNEILKKIKKTQTTKECVQAMKNLRKHGIESHAFIMVGFPDETEETFKQTMDFIPELKPDGVIFSIFTPYPGSDIYNECKDKEIIKGDFDLVLYNHQSPLNCFTKNIPKERFYELRKEAFEFVDNYNRKAKLRRGIASLKNLGIVATWKRVYRYFYSKFLNYTIVKSS